MTETRYSYCGLCEAMCGLEITVDADRNEVVKVRGDAADHFSRGHICPKGVALADLQADPDRLRAPLRRVGDAWEPIGWDEALDLAGRRLAEVQRAHGKDAVGVYYGNPTGHSYSASLALLALRGVVGTRNVFSANSVDALPRLLTSFLMYGNQAILPVPDVDRTDLLLMLGANPLVSNGSIMTAGDIKARLKAVQARGGRLVVVDPRRTQTAAMADAHLPIRPGTDALLLLAMLQVLFAEGRVDLGRFAPHVDGLDAVAARVKPFTPARVAEPTGIAAETIADLARQLADTPRAAVYGRVGTSVQRFGAVTSWLVDLLNLLTGHFDEPGGAMFAQAPVDLPALVKRLGETGSYATYRSRVRGLPEFNGELPVAALAEEIEAPGDARIRALVTHAGNPVLSTPQGPDLGAALAGLDFMVAVDFYLNETTRHAHLILPPTSPLERSNYPLLFQALSVRNGARFSDPVLDAPADARHDWEILMGLGARLARHRGGLGRVQAGLMGGFAGARTPERLLGLLLRLGPRKLSLKALRDAPHGLDFGPLEPRMPGLLATADQRIRLAPEPLVADLDRVAATLDTATPALSLIGRRTLRSNNSWMHNSDRLVRGPERCTLMVHPDDADARGLVDGETVWVRSAVGAIQVPLQRTDAVRPGVVCMPHGWGHGQEGTRLRVANARPGVNMNALTSVADVDAVSGVSVLNGVEVQLSRD